MGGRGLNACLRALPDLSASAIVWILQSCVRSFVSAPGAFAAVSSCSLKAAVLTCSLAAYDADGA
jgi:hypothetical protein